MKGRKRRHSCERPASQTALCCFKCSPAYQFYGQSSNQPSAVQQRQPDKVPALSWWDQTCRDMNDYIWGVIAAEQEPPTSFHLVY